MKRDEVLAVLRPLEGELKGLGFAKLYLFGSAARSDPDAHDVDLLYEAEGALRPGFHELTDAWDRLEEILGKRVDLIDRKLLHRRILPRVETEMVEVY
ncbi:MAG: nucleotidyltransferase domain-containing protein [Alphaproteobacteria bacterium]|nr:nucleotidyltransferase domain-containing protein [Alphaproteobacteria bacterium]MBV9370466.1 nucleotidyltransferase domain-containing protein [Alphaproteobacteria bacterium]MBV9900024.1 nucleotidyltransferase domain-containing protein [Alphaproteobacteria bacterium]